MSPADITEILIRARGGDPAAAKELLELVYDRLRSLAAFYVRRGRRNQTLQATDIVHEAYLNLVNQTRAEWKDRTHFMGVAASAMRQVLVAYARKRGAQKRGGGRRRLPLRDTMALSGQPDFDVLCLEEALSGLEKLHSRQARVVELRFFGGLTYDEIGENLGISAKTAEADWHVAKAWLHRELSRG